jgi:hypothetical protein
VLVTAAAVDVEVDAAVSSPLLHAVAAAQSTITPNAALVAVA